MKMSQCPGCKTRAEAKGGAAGGTTHAVFIAWFNKRGEKNGSDLRNSARYKSPGTDVTDVTVLAVMEDAVFVDVAITHAIKGFKLWVHFHCRIFTCTWH